MKSLYLRLYLTVLTVLALFALASGWLLQRHLDDQRGRAEGVVRERMAAWGDFLQRSLPAAEASNDEQAAAVNDWSQRLRLPIALDDANGKRIASSPSFLRRDLDSPGAANRRVPVRLDDGRTLWVMRPGTGLRAGMPGAAGTGLPGAAGTGLPGAAGMGLPGAAGTGMPGAAGIGMPGAPGMGLRGDGARVGERSPVWWLFRGPPGWPDGLGLVLWLAVLFLAVAAGAWPVVRRLTRRLEALKQGVEAFGAGNLQQRVAEDGQDEVAAVGASFNRAASRVQALLLSHQSLLANASHELRSPLARLKMAVSLMEDLPTAQHDALKREIHTNIAELDALVEEVLLASRLDAANTQGTLADPSVAPVALLALAAEEAARVGALADGQDLSVRGDERLLRRAVRNLVENARRHGAGAIEIHVDQVGNQVHLRVCDRGPGVPPAYRERIFEAFFRLPGQAEREGGVGLGLALVRQIATRHGGHVRCLPRDGGGSCFELSLPAL